MPVSTPNISSIHRLAKQLEEDIRRRGLKIGDRYLSAHEAAELLGVSQATAQRAMKVLGDSEKLLRRRSLGTFVGPGVAGSSTAKVLTVYVLSPAEDQSSGPARAGWMLQGICRATGSTNVNFGLIPKNDRIQYVKQLMQFAKSSGPLLGVIAMGGNREVYQYLAESGVPTVVFGSLYQDNAQLPSIDLDNREAARLMTRYLIDRGHKRMMLLTMSEGRPGDHDFVDGVSDTLTEADLPANALAIRIVPDDMQEALPMVRQFLSSADRPSGLIVRGMGIGGAVDKAIADLGLTVPDEVEVVCQSVNSERESIPKHPHVMPKIEMEKIAGKLGHMLKRRAKGQPIEKTKVVLPVELRGANFTGPVKNPG